MAAIGNLDRWPALAPNIPDWAKTADVGQFAPDGQAQGSDRQLFLPSSPIRRVHYCELHTLRGYVVMYSVHLAAKLF